MPLFWRFTAAVTSAIVLSPAFLFKPDSRIPIRPERCQTVAEKLRKLMKDFKKVNPPKICRVLNLPLIEFLRWFEEPNDRVKSDIEAY